MVTFGEVGLSGEIRSVGQALARVKEAASLGFETILLPQGNIALLEKEDLPGVRLVGVQNIKEAIDKAF
jgi:DNA repair protein RadA/Sms